MIKFIGIDPDIDKSGFAVWDRDRHEFDDLGCLSFFEITERIMTLNCFDLTVVVEAGWLNKKSNFHNRTGQSKAVGEKIAKAVGANHQVGKLFVEFCIKNKIKCIEVKPISKKLNSAQFKALTGYTKGTNSEKRDSAMLVYGR